MKKLIFILFIIVILGCSKEHPPQLINPNPIISIYQLKDISYNDLMFITIDEDSNIINKTTPYTYRYDKYDIGYGYYTISNEDLYDNTYVTSIIIKSEFDTIRCTGHHISDSILLANIIGKPYNKYMVITDYSISHYVESIMNDIHNGSIYKYCNVIK